MKEMQPLLAMLALVATPFGDFLGLSRTPEGPGLPIGWRIRPVRGSPPPSFAILEQRGEGVLRISGKGAAAWAYLELKTPIGVAAGALNWSWRVLELPAGADIRSKDKDDAALRVYVVFAGRRGLLGRRDRVIFYTWGNAEPQGLTQRSFVSDRIQVVRVAGAMEANGSWREQTVDPFADHRRFWGTEPTPIIALGVMQDTDQTNSRASAEVRSIGWSPR